MASGLSIGLAIGLGGVAAVALGAVADVVDLETAVLVTALGPALCIFLTLLLPPPRAPAAPEPAPAATADVLMPETAREFFERAGRPDRGRLRAHARPHGHLPLRRRAAPAAGASPSTTAPSP